MASNAPARPANGAGAWQVWIDAGGTFTDCVAIDPAGREQRLKVLSSSALRGRIAERVSAHELRIAGLPPLPVDFLRGFSLHLLGIAAAPVAVIASAAGGQLVRSAAPLAPEVAWRGAACELRSPEEAAVLATRLVTATAPGAALPRLALRLATTRGTNALLERSGAPPVLFITRGFADLLAIGTQQRPELFSLAIVKPPPLYTAVVEVDERLDAAGEVLTPLDLAAVEPVARELVRGGQQVAAVAFLHSYRNPRHEEAVGELLRRVGFRHVALSAALAPLIRIVPRAETAVVEAYLAPVLGGYLERVAGPIQAGGGTVHVMTSAGGLVPAASFRAKDGLLSGPAGGVVGAARAGRRSGLARVIGFDMGGTSTDVARYDGDYDYQFEHQVGAAHLVAPALAIESVAAGGGSICRFDGAQLLVGPESAGAFPGPACYGAGGPLTVTDVNLLLGRLEPERFAIPIAPAAAEQALAALAGELTAAGQQTTAEAILEGLLEIANERMAEAIRSISLRRGEDPAGYALVAFGGAGPQHACAVAELLGIGTVLVPSAAGLLSACGLGAAVVERFAERQVLLPLAEVLPQLEAWMRELGAAASAAVAGESGEAVVVRRCQLALRFVGQQTTLPIEVRPGEDPAPAFLAAYRRLYGYEPEGRALELESMRVVASTVAPPIVPAPAPPLTCAVGATGRRRRRRIGGVWREIPALDRDELPPGTLLAGPALVFERHTATVIEPAWEAWCDGADALVLRRQWEARGV